MPTDDVWTRLLERLRPEFDPDDFRRLFSSSGYASDSGDLITVWVGTESERRHLVHHFLDRLQRELAALGRPETQIRFVVSGSDEEEDEGETPLS